MRVLRDPREVAELWLCDRFIPAFHFVFGWPHKANPVYKSIRRSGALLPAGEVGRYGLFVLDVLAGDDRYNFLAAVGRPMGISDPVCYGFVFDAEQLVAEGALIGKQDLLPEYDRAAQRVLSDEGFDLDQIHVNGRTKFSPEAMRRFVNYEAGRSWGESEHKSIQPYLPQMLAAIEAVQNKHRLSGSDALQALHTYASTVCGRMQEILSTTASLMHNPGFGEKLEHYTTSEFFKDWSLATACAVAARDTYVMESSSRLVLPFDLASPPEILWPGRLSLSKAVAAFELPCMVRGSLRGTLDWPDDIFRLLCPTPVRES